MKKSTMKIMAFAAALLSLTAFSACGGLYILHNDPVIRFNNFV